MANNVSLFSSLPSGQNLAYLAALSGGFGAGGGGGMGFDPSMYMDPRARMKLGLAQNLMTEATSTAPTLSPFAGLSRLGAALAGMKMVGDVYGGQQDQGGQQQVSPQEQQQFDTWGDTIGPKGSLRRNAWEATPVAEKRLAIFQQAGQVFGSYATATGSQLQGNLPSGDTLRNVSWFNQNKDTMSPTQRSQSAQAIGQDLYSGRWAYDTDAQGNFINIRPVGEATPAYKGQVAYATSAGAAWGSLTPDLRKQYLTPTQDKDGNWVTPAAILGVPKDVIAATNPNTGEYNPPAGGGAPPAGGAAGSRGAIGPAGPPGATQPATTAPATAPAAPGTAPATSPGQSATAPAPTAPAASGAPPATAAAAPAPAITAPAPATTKRADLYDRYGLVRPSTDPRVVEPMLDQIQHRESGGRNIPSQLDEDSTGLYQISQATWHDFNHAINPATGKLYASAMDAPPEVQRDVARRLFAARGEQPWMGSNANYLAAHPRAGAASAAATQTTGAQPLQPAVPAQKNMAAILPPFAGETTPTLPPPPSPYGPAAQQRALDQQFALAPGAPYSGRVEQAVTDASVLAPSPPPTAPTAPATAPAAPAAPAAPTAPPQAAPAEVGPGTRRYDPKNPLAGIDQSRYTYGADSPYTAGYTQAPAPYGTIAVPKSSLPGPKEAIAAADADYKANQGFAEAARNGQFNIEGIKHDIDILNGPGGWNSGPLVQAREDLVKLWNNGMNFLDPNGLHPGSRMSMDQIQSVEDWRKNQTRLGFSLSQATGQGTDKVFEAANAAVPNPELSPAGAKLLTSEIDVLNKRAIAKHDMQFHWQTAPGNPQGVLVGSNEEFEKQYPPKFWANLAIYNTLDPDYVTGLAAATKANGGKIPPAWNSVFTKRYGPDSAAFALAQYHQGFLPGQD
jgi:hypothetical protein